MCADGGPAAFQFLRIRLEENVGHLIGQWPTPAPWGTPFQGYCFKPPSLNAVSRPAAPPAAPHKINDLPLASRGLSHSSEKRGPNRCAAGPSGADAAACPGLSHAHRPLPTDPHPSSTHHRACVIPRVSKGSRSCTAAATAAAAGPLALVAFPRASAHYHRSSSRQAKPSQSASVPPRHGSPRLARTSSRVCP